MPKYIKELRDWPKFRWREKALSVPLAAVHASDSFLGAWKPLASPLRSEACLEQVALNLEYIGIEQVREQAKSIANTEYGQYLFRLLEQPDPE